MHSSSVIVSSALLETGAEEILKRIEAAKKRIHNIASDQIREEFNREIDDLVIKTLEIKLSGESAKRENPNYLEELNGFPCAKKLFTNIDALHATCKDLQNRMQNLIYSVTRGGVPGIVRSKHTMYQEKPSRDESTRTIGLRR